VKIDYYPGEAMSLITIAQFNKPEDAHMLRMRLEAGDVAVFIQDEHLVQLDWGLANAVGGVRVQIDEEDIERAREILADEPDTTPPSDRPACPACGSTSTGKDELPRRVAFLTIMLLGIPLLFSKKRWKCHACQASWEL